jgi:nucleotidyltransferase/DNA polymerase involved in DNA repair
MLSVLDKSELTGVCGLGWGLERHLKELGIESFPKLRAETLPFLQKHFGPHWSVHLYNIARGVDEVPVMPITAIADAKSVGRTYTTHRTLTNRSEINRLIRNLCEEAAYKARQMGLCGRYVGLVLRSGDRDKIPAPGGLASRTFSEGWFGHRTLKHYIDDGREFFDICRQIANDWNVDSVRFCGVTLGMLEKRDYRPVPLFKKDRTRQRLLKTVDNVNGKYGDYTVYPGQLLGMPLIMPEVNGFFGDRKFRLEFSNR